MWNAQKFQRRRPAFQAALSGNQTGIASVTQTKLAFASEVMDVGGNYDNALYRWTPPAGKPAYIGVGMNIQGASAGASVVVQIFKNGAQLAAQVFIATAGGEIWGSVDLCELPNGTDYYEAYVFGASGATLTATASAYTRFYGMVQ